MLNNTATLMSPRNSLASSPHQGEMGREIETERQRDKEKRGIFSEKIGSSNIYLFNSCVADSEGRYSTLAGCFILLQFCFAVLFFSSVTQNYIVFFLSNPETRCGDRQPSLSPREVIVGCAQRVKSQYLLLTISNY